jgi:hypothetical protein
MTYEPLCVISKSRTIKPSESMEPSKAAAPLSDSSIITLLVGNGSKVNCPDTGYEEIYA